MHQLRLSLYVTMKKIALIITLIALGGCSAIGSRPVQGDESPYFIGVRNDVYYLFHPSKADNPYLQPLNIIDFPFSLIADILYLPYDFYTVSQRNSGNDSAKNI